MYNADIPKFVSENEMNPLMPEQNKNAFLPVQILQLFFIGRINWHKNEVHLCTLNL